MAVCNWQRDRLGRGQPDRKATRIVLDENPGEAFHGAEQRAVDQDRPMVCVVSSLIGELEALGHEEVELTGPALPRAPERVGDVKVDLRPVERAAAGVQLVLTAESVQCRRQRRLGLLPLLVAPDRLRGLGRELDPNVVETEVRVELIYRLANVGHLSGDLLLGAKDVGIVLGERAHAEQAV